MKTNRAFLACLILVSPLFLVMEGRGQDAVKVAPDHYKVLLETKKVRVLDITYKPGEKTPMYTHPNGIAYYITDAKFRFTLPDGTSIEREGKAGQAIEAPGGLHAPENIGTADAHVILVEMKPSAKKMKK